MTTTTEERRSQQFERILRHATQLKEKGHLTMEELQATADCHRRTIYRDMHLLVRMGMAKAQWTATRISWKPNPKHSLMAN